MMHTMNLDSGSLTIQRAIRFLQYGVPLMLVDWIVGVALLGEGEAQWYKLDASGLTEKGPS